MLKRISKRIFKACKHFKYNKLRTKYTNKTNDWILKNRIRKENPYIFHFNNTIYFTYEPRYLSHFYSQLKDKNIIKPSAQQIFVLREIIRKLEEDLFLN